MTMKVIEDTVMRSLVYGDKIKHITYILYNDGTWEKREYFVHMSEKNSEVEDEE